MTGRLAVISDMHIAPPDAGMERAQSTRDTPLRRYRRLITTLAEVEDFRPEVVLFGGDNVNQPVDRPGYSEALLALLSEGTSPRHFIPGNHDIGSTVGWHHHDPAALTRARDCFVDRFGPDWWCIETAGFEIIGINSQLFGSSLTAAAKQERWLRKVLRKSTSLKRILFLHTPPCLQGWDDDFSDGSEQMCLRPPARKPLAGIIRDCPPDILMSTHVHRYWVRREPLWWWIGISATALPLSEMEAVPDHAVPPGTDMPGWVSLERDGSRRGWRAELHPLM